MIVPIVAICKNKLCQYVKLTMDTCSTLQEVIRN
jgi:hypothetical protein